MRRVVITGLGLVTPLGSGVEESWRALRDGRTGIRTIDGFKTDDLPSTIAGQIPRGNGPGLFNVDEYVTPKDQRRMSDFIVYGLAAAQQALRDSGWSPESDLERTATGVIIGSGVGGMSEIANVATPIDTEPGAVRRVSPFFITANLINLLAGQVSIRHGLKGPNLALSTACATGAHAIGEAARLIQWGDADVMVAGGAEAPVCHLGLAGFSRARMLSTAWNDRPERASRPWDKSRDGFVIAEGAGIVVLEDLEHARKRGASIHAEVAGYGLTGDAHHVTHPAPDGRGMARCMAAALKRAELQPDDIDYINAHGASSSADLVEVDAIKSIFNGHASEVAVSSTKSATGHMLGAAGAVETIFSVLAIRDGIIPPTLNLDEPDVGCDLNMVAHEAQHRRVRAALNNAFGFGGTNASLVIKACR